MKAVGLVGLCLVPSLNTNAQVLSNVGNKDTEIYDSLEDLKSKVNSFINTKSIITTLSGNTAYTCTEDCIMTGYFVTYGGGPSNISIDGVVVAQFGNNNTAYAIWGSLGSYLLKKGSVITFSNCTGTGKGLTVKICRIKY